MVGSCKRRTTFHSESTEQEDFSQAAKNREKTIYLPYQQQLALKTGCEALRK